MEDFGIALVMYTDLDFRGRACFHKLLRQMPSTSFVKHQLNLIQKRAVE
jgi:hypothetical protein